ncbi:MAG: YggS family pyridoxal phosphate-dependent enzyme [Cytophagales bacterium]|nr:YggS family pyridoxal phosphate-dependent enzyme [Cytophagales bacterium]
MSIAENIRTVTQKLAGTGCRLIAVTKTKPAELLLEAHGAGCKTFGENRVQEMVEKYEQLPKDIDWHLIGHLQTNKVKYMAPFVRLVHSVDSFKLLQEIDRQAAKNSRVIECLLQIYIAREETKFGLSFDEARELLAAPETAGLAHVRIVGLMGMATFTDDREQIRAEFRSLKQFFDSLKTAPLPANAEMRELSMGMSGDYDIAVEEGSTLIRVGSSIFGAR